MQKLEKKIFLICPVRFASEEEDKFLDNYVGQLESQGCKVHYPKRDTNQKDATGGYRICSDNYQAIKEADEIHVYWTKTSQGSLFDLGVAFNEHKTKNKPIKLVNGENIEKIIDEEKKEKSFEQVLLCLDNWMY